MRTCTVEGCPRAHRAKGLCSTHYNQANYTADERNPKVLVACGWCGKDVVRSAGSARKYANSFCGLACRDAFRMTQIDDRPVPWKTCPACGHKWFKPGDQAKLCVDCRAARPQPRLRPCWISGPCQDCGTHFTDVWLAESSARYCSRKCSRRVAKRARRARERQSAGSFAWTEVIHLYLVFDRRCAYCCELIDGQPDPDHVTPLSRGGHNTIGNILPACRECNCDKNDLLLDEWNADRARRGLGPRVTTWDVHDPRYAHLTAQRLGTTTLASRVTRMPQARGTYPAPVHVQCIDCGGPAAHGRRRCAECLTEIAESNAA